jgi:TDG/mug DNA glycosylase family protein
VAGFSRADLEAARNVTVPDLIGPGVRLLFVGINPGLWTAAAQAHFARPGNRFYPALLRAGIIYRSIAPSAGMTEDDRSYLVRRGVGITNLAPRATARADELTPAELREGAAALTRLVERESPRVVAVLGVTAYRTAFGVRRASAGHQSNAIGGAALWVVPNPSGLNAHETIDSLAHTYAEAARAAGITLDS